MLQVNPTALTQNISLVNEIRKRTLLEHFTEIGKVTINEKQGPGFVFK